MDWRTRPTRWLLHILSASWRIREEIPDEVAPIIRGEQPGVLVFWHGGMFPIWYRFRGGRFAALVSASRDGGILSTYLEKTLGYRHVIRGSNSRGGSEALREMTEALATTGCLITTDGPRGPAQKAKPGALIAAHRSGCGVVAIGWGARHCIQFRSWDNMRIPFPFATVVFRYCKITPTPTPVTATVGVHNHEPSDGANSPDGANPTDNTIPLTQDHHNNPNNETINRTPGHDRVSDHEIHQLENALEFVSHLANQAVKRNDKS